MRNCIKPDFVTKASDKELYSCLRLGVDEHDLRFSQKPTQSPCVRNVGSHRRKAWHGACNMAAQIRCSNASRFLSNLELDKRPIGMWNVNNLAYCRKQPSGHPQEPVIQRHSPLSFAAAEIRVTLSLESPSNFYSTAGNVNGVFVVTEESLPSGAPVALSVTMPFGGFSVAATVDWSSHDASEATGGCQGIGLRFGDVEEPVRWLIGEFTRERPPYSRLCR